MSGPRVASAGPLVMSTIRIACLQLAPILGDVEGNRGRALDAIHRAAADGAGLIILPELASSGYVFADADEARACAEPAGGATASAWAAAAAELGVVVVGGFCELDDDRPYNSAMLADPSGIRAVYRKLHLWDREKLIFEPGGAPPPLVDTVHGRIGLGICYDLLFPEVTRRLALAGADVLVFPTNSPLLAPEPEAAPMEVAVALTTAYQNRVVVAVADRCGTERCVDWVGGSVIADPFGHSLAGPPDDRRVPSMLIADVDLAQARDKRWGDRNDLIGDRRADIYGDL